MTGTNYGNPCKTLPDTYMQTVRSDAAGFSNTCLGVNDAAGQLARSHHSCRTNRAYVLLLPLAVQISTCIGKRSELGIISGNHRLRERLVLSLLLVVRFEKICAGQQASASQAWKLSVVFVKKDSWHTPNVQNPSVDRLILKIFRAENVTVSKTCRPAHATQTINGER